MVRQRNWVFGSPEGSTGISKASVMLIARESFDGVGREKYRKQHYVVFSRAKGRVDHRFGSLRRRHSKIADCKSPKSRLIRRRLVMLPRTCLSSWSCPQNPLRVGVGVIPVACQNRLYQVPHFSVLCDKALSHTWESSLEM